MPSEKVVLAAIAVADGPRTCDSHKIQHVRSSRGTEKLVVV
jgi:hypothetical protein